MQKITIQLTDEQLEKIGYANPWICVDDELPKDKSKQYEVCSRIGAISLSALPFNPDVMFWRCIPEPPIEAILNKRQQKLDL